MNNHIRLDNVCTICPISSKPSTDGKKCICMEKYIWSDYSYKCELANCYPNSIPNATKNGI